MERTGIRIDLAVLQTYRAGSSRKSNSLTAEVHEFAGKPFNISSPQQLGKVLFEDLNLPAPVKYGKGKTISTAADVLEELAPGYPIAARCSITASSPS